MQCNLIPKPPNLVANPCGGSILTILPHHSVHLLASCYYTLKLLLVACRPLLLLEEQRNIVHVLITIIIYSLTIAADKRFGTLLVYQRRSSIDLEIVKSPEGLKAPSCARHIVVVFVVVVVAPA